MGKVMAINDQQNMNKFIGKKNKIALGMLTAFATSALAITPTLHAEEVDAVEKEESRIEVITVTAQKRVQNILKVPVTVGTVSADTIEESSSITLSEIDKFIPGFDFGEGSMTQSGISMRGISSPAISVGGDPSSATFFDDIYMPRAAQNIVFSDMARIEVLKGPQGTLFGRNAAMGVVNMVPNAPQAEFEGFVKATLGTDNLQRYEGMVNVPIVDNFYMRANFLANARDGIVENVSAPSWNDNYKIWDLGEQAHNAARISFLWDISSATNLQFSYDWDDLEQAPPMAVGVSEYAYNGGKTPFADKAENDVRNGVESRDMTAMTMKLNHEFSDAFSMKYVVSYREWQTINRQDDDGTADITRYFSTSNNEDSDIFYTELQFNYVSDKVNAVAGFSYSKEDVSQTTELNITADTAARMATDILNAQAKQGVAGELESALGGNTDAHAQAAFGPDVTFSGAVDTLYLANFGGPMDHLWNAGEWANFLNVSGAIPGMTEGIVNATGDFTYNAFASAVGEQAIFGPSFAGQFWEESVNNTGDFTNWGIYADVDYSLTDKWNLIGGVRYSKDEKDFSWYIPLTSFAEQRPGVENILFEQVNMATSDSWDKVTGRLVTSYQVTDDHMLFGSYSTGYKSGGYDSLAPSEQSFDPENTTNYEFGYKGIVWGQVIANISAYYLEITDLQSSISSQTPDSGGKAIPTIISVDKDITGVELDIRWMASDSLTLGVVSEIRSTDTYTPDFYNGEGDLIAAQKSSIDASMNYTLTLDFVPDFGVGSTNFHLDYVFLENNNADQAGLEDYKKAVSAYFKDTKNLNARLSWSNDDDDLEFGLWGKNLLDERYVLGLGGLAADVLGTPFGSVNRGLEAGIDFKYSF
jgi:outer membrane receptor protein involved in Fe transport